jgi:hypothetical protein
MCVRDGAGLSLLLLLGTKQARRAVKSLYWAKADMERSMFHDLLALRGVEGRKAAPEIALEIVDILQSDVQPQRRAARRPSGGRAVGCAVERNDEAFEAAP